MLIKKKFYITFYQYVRNDNQLYNHRKSDDVNSKLFYYTVGQGTIFANSFVLSPM